MSFFPSLPADAGARHLLALNPEAGRALVAFHCAVLRHDTALTARDKELLAAYVSGLNACQYCHGVHRETAIAFGVDAGLLDALLSDLEQAPVEPRLRPLLAFARKLTLTPSRMAAADAQAAFDAGWSERDLHDAVLTIGLFNLMNRLLEGHGIKGSDELYASRGKALAEDGYAPLLAWLPEASG
ncbi:carboxymuconolactone decarboxylase family protein [Rubrivivax albus]|uniref:Peroxidase n=1 Tax=Rubrivivax albus TaxID=2499835 RepID=A0A3S3SAB9_9BURK|nr:peroxidase-related enzyme [Rubrivivax albus]RVT49599.1 peroxidase [Rubrivivax albus]